MTSATIDSARMRQVMGHFCTGVTVITAVHDGDPVGMACQSFTSLSLEPAYISFAPALTSTTWPRIRAAGRFVVNVLAEDQQDVCRAMGRSGGEKFADVDWEPAGNGAPRLAGSLAWIEANVEHVVPGGDHEIVIGRVGALELPRDAAPLLFYKGAYAGLAG
ncbi:flavin reductase family protein [Yinghuangia seranimata]|uniref:flavin reductase family protein n=1 Tax=Yinghuangia seranimata TaxID=408067 RepID=UPI00248C39FF|nr:flavin reductase family protein [Yinghuangia seranimata]MDI2130251.1 flavin reductase family protein [Yinghuangia seranimata]